MTVALALACTDGALLATDSMGMIGKIATNISKIQALNHAPMIWTFSGSTYVAQELESRVSSQEASWFSGIPEGWGSMTALDVKQFVETNFLPLIRSAYGQLVEPPGGEVLDHGIDLMVGAWTERAGAVLIRVFADLAVMLGTEPMSAMGYGHDYATVARGLMSHHLQESPDLHAGKLLAHRTIAAVCDVSSGGVGLPVQLATVDASGARVLEIDEVEATSLAVERWKTLEREALVNFTRGTIAGSATLRQDLPEIATP